MITTSRSRGSQLARMLVAAVAACGVACSNGAGGGTTGTGGSMGTGGATGRAVRRTPAVRPAREARLGRAARPEPAELVELQDAAPAVRGVAERLPRAARLARVGRQGTVRPVRQAPVDRAERVDQACRRAPAVEARRALPVVVAATRARRAAPAAGAAAPGTCTASKPAGTSATGTGPHKVTVETNADPGISEGTIFRPTDLGGAEKYPIFVWGEGGCSKNGLSNAAAMAEIASHGYFVIADGTPNGTGNRAQDRSMLKAMAAPLVAYIDWAIAENDKPCSAYYQSLETTKVSANGFSCGGLMSQAMVLDPRIITWGVNSSGMAGANQTYYDMVKTPVLFVEGGSGDIAYDGGRKATRPSAS